MLFTYNNTQHNYLLLTLQSIFNVAMKKNQATQKGCRKKNVRHRHISNKKIGFIEYDKRGNVD